MASDSDDGIEYLKFYDDDLMVSGNKYLLNMEDDDDIVPIVSPSVAPIPSVAPVLESGKKYEISYLKETYQNYKFFKILELFGIFHGLKYMRYFDEQCNLQLSGYTKIWATEYCDIYCKSDRCHAFKKKYKPHNCENPTPCNSGDDNSGCTLS